MKLTRSRNGIISGVAAGIARSTGIDPTWVRVGFVLLTLLGGGGALIYGVLWAVIPRDGATSTIAEDGLGKALHWYKTRDSKRL